MKLRENCFWIFLPILLLAAGAVLAAPKHGAPKNVSECGTILAEPGNYKLVNDLLDCPESGVGIQGSDITLNLHGYEISCADNNLEVAGVYTEDPLGGMLRNITIKNGRVSNCRDGIVLIGTEDSKVMNITSTGNTKWEPAPGVFVYGTGITVWLSRNNVIRNNNVYGNASHGIGSWESSGNLFKHNTMTGNGAPGGQGSGINLNDEHNSKVLCNRIHANTDGIAMFQGSSGNLLRGNLVTGNLDTGIGTIGFYWQDPEPPYDEYYYAMPVENTIRSNIIVEGHSWVDVFEAYWDFGINLLPNPDGICRNTWEKNQFGTEIGVPGCIGTSVILEENDVCALQDDHDD